MSSTILINPYSFASSGIAPDDIAGLLVWLKNGTDLWEDTGKTQPATTGETVAVWGDSSGNGRDFTGTNEPLLETVNSKLVLHLDGSNDELSATGALTLKPATFFCLFSPDTLAVYHTILSDTDGSTGMLCVQVEQTTGNIRLLAEDEALLGTSTSGISAGSFARIIVTYSAIGEYAFYINGAAAGSGTTNHTIISGPPSISRNTALPVDGRYGEWGLYDSVLSGGDITDLDAYLQSIGI